VGLFGRSKGDRGSEPGASGPVPDPGSRWDPEMQPQDFVREQIARDPMVGVKLAGREVLERVLAALKDERGVQVETVATALGALAGRACHLAARDGVQNERPEYAGLSLISVGTKDGQTYLMGPAINRPLLERPLSVWGLVAGFAQSTGATPPDVHELAAHGASTLGGPQFGRPRYAPGTGSATLPVQYLGAWEPMLAHIRPLAPDPQQWPAVYGLQGLFERVRGQFDLTDLTRVVMDSAIAMSKVPVTA
jgi:hypothetical protein